MIIIYPSMFNKISLWVSRACISHLWPAHISWPGLTLDANCPSLLITIMIKTSFSGALKFRQLLGQSGEGQTSGRACRLSPPPSLRWHKSIQIRSTPGTQPKRAQHTRRTNKQLQQNELTTPLHLDNSEKKPAFHPEVHLCSVHFRQLPSVNYYRKSSCNW